MAEGQGNVIRRKLGAARAEADARAREGRPGADQCWRIALARAARDRVKLALDVPTMSLDRMSLAEVLELAPDRGLIAVLEGPAGALGVMMLAPDVLAGLIEAQTTGIVTAQPAAQRRPTRTDAAMAAGMIDGALEELERGVDGLDDCLWAKGYRYASFLEDIRPLGLLLEDVAYRLFRAEANLALGAKKGSIFMALPSELATSGEVPSEAARQAAEVAGFHKGLAMQLMAAECRLDGVLARTQLSLSQIMEFEVGQVLALPGAAVERISLEGMDGRKLCEGRLGQNRGLRAVRLSEPVSAAAAAPALSGQHLVARAATPEPFDAPLKATGTG